MKLFQVTCSNDSTNLPNDLNLNLFPKGAKFVSAWWGEFVDVSNEAIECVLMRLPGKKMHQFTMLKLESCFVKIGGDDW